MAMCDLCDHSQDTSIGMIGAGDPGMAAQGLVEPFEMTGGPEILPWPGRELPLSGIVNQGIAEVSTQGRHRFWLSIPIFAGHPQVTT